MAVERHSFIPEVLSATMVTSSGVQRLRGTKTKSESTNWDSMFGTRGYAKV